MYCSFLQVLIQELSAIVINIALREYPMKFAVHLANLAPDLARTCLGRPPLPPGKVPPALETFKGMQYGDALYSFADLKLRGMEGGSTQAPSLGALIPTRAHVDACSTRTYIRTYIHT